MRKYIKKFQSKGMIGVSSKYLVRRMLNKIDFSRDIIIIQYGVGTGVFTKEILKRMTQNSKLYAFEIEKNYKPYLEDIMRDNRLIYIEDSAENIHKYVHTKADVVVSTLPFASLPKEILPRIVEPTRSILKKDSLFLQYQYFLTDKFRMEKYFGKKISLDFEIRNFPPAFIYSIENNENK